LAAASAAVAVTMGAAALGGTALAQQPLRIGFIYVGPVGDGGWTYSHDVGRKSMEAKLKGKVQTTYVESVPEGADAERVVRDLAAKGHQIVFTTSFGYMDQTLKAAKSFPKSVF
jgi:simple sugar transport system substrate-binding protein